MMRALVLILCMLLPGTASAEPFFKGVNLASGSFGGKARPGVYGKDYIYAGPESVDYYAGKGFNLFRIALLWERLQPAAKGPLSAAELGRLDALVSHITGKGLYAILDVHNYAKYYGVQIGAGVPIAAFRDLWGKLAAHYKSSQRVLFDLMNEPHSMPTATVKAMQQSALAEIRKRGAANTVLVEGNGFSGAHNWLTIGNDASAPLATMGSVLFEPHQYLDKTQSGTQGGCVSGTIGVDRIQAVTNWARGARVKLLLGEFAGGVTQDAAVCKAAVQGMLQFMVDNSDVWSGWSWWAGGPWWGGYKFTLEPANGLDRPQMPWLEPFLR